MILGRLLISPLISSRSRRDIIVSPLREALKGLGKGGDRVSDQLEHIELAHFIPSKQTTDNIP